MLSLLTTEHGRVKSRGKIVDIITFNLQTSVKYVGRRHVEFDANAIIVIIIVIIYRHELITLILLTLFS